MERLDAVLVKRHPEFSRNRLQGLIEAGFVRVNGAVVAKAGAKVSETDEIEVTIPPPVPAVPEPEDIPLSVLYEDEHLLALDKPAGLVVHPAPGHFTGTLVNALLHRCPDLAGIGGVARPGIVHRLDRDTSGVMVVAKTQRAMEPLVRAFSSHAHVGKTYLAVVHGTPPSAKGRIENLIGRSPRDRKKMAIVPRNGKVAVTNWRVVGSRPYPVAAGTFSLVECRIETGRTHQIRVHLASLGCPVAGDAAYGKPSLDRRLAPPPVRQLLHAWRLALRHPVTGVALEFEAPVPADFRDAAGDLMRAVTAVPGGIADVRTEV